nr:hypothetical protein [Tanacetum cinerariifolium]
REILNICPKIPGQEFYEPPSEEETLSFIREFGHSGEIKLITDVNVDHLHQPWRAFATIINKCLSGKVFVYGALLPRAMMNQAMLDSNSYKTYYAIATGAKPPKPKKIQTKSDSTISSEETSSKKKPAKAKKDAFPTKKPTTKP